MEIIDLISNLKTYEMERKAREAMTPQKKKTIACKYTLTIFDDEEEEDHDEDLSLIVRNI